MAAGDRRRASKWLRWAGGAILCGSLGQAPAQAQPPPTLDPDPADCDAAATAAEQSAGLPGGLLRAIGRVETGRYVAATGRVQPWPWSTNMNGADHVFASKDEAVAWTAAQLAAGQRSIDVGCFQINLKYHPDAFPSLEAAFDPTANGQYAARFLTELYRRSAGWQMAAAQYHSGDPALGTPYGERVFGILGGALPAAAGGSDGHFLRVALDAPAPAFGIQVFRPHWASAAAAASGGALPHPAAAAESRAMPSGLIRVLTIRGTTRRLPAIFTPG